MGKLLEKLQGNEKLRLRKEMLFLLGWKWKWEEIRLLAAWEEWLWYFKVL